MDTVRITGHDAIKYAERHPGSVLARSTRSVDGVQEGLTLEEARTVAAEDPGGICVVDVDLDDLRQDACEELRKRDRHHAPGSETVLVEAWYGQILDAGSASDLHEILEWYRTYYDALDATPDLDLALEEITDLGVEPEEALRRARKRRAAARLREVRDRCGLTLSELSARWDLDRSTLHRWETGALLPGSPGMLEDALAALETSAPAG